MTVECDALWVSCVAYVGPRSLVSMSLAGAAGFGSAGLVSAE